MGTFVEIVEILGQKMVKTWMNNVEWRLVTGH